MRKIQYILFILVGLLAVNFAHAQQQVLFTQYMNQMLYMNPAYAGAKGVTSATLIAREQWTGIEGHPGTQSLFVHSPMTDQTGIGGSITNDRIGIVNNTDVYADYSYSINYPGDKYLSFGLKAGFSLYFAELSTVDLGGMASELPDPAFLYDINNPFMPNAGVGIYYSTPNYYLGFSAPKLIANRIIKTEVETNTVSREELHMFFMGGYVFDLNRIIKFKPYFMLRAVPNAPLSLDLTAQFVLVDMLWLGATYRAGNAFGFMAQIKVNEQLSVGYAYDLTTTVLRQHTGSGTHEIMIGYDFSFGRGRVRSPRYF